MVVGWALRVERGRGREFGVGRGLCIGEEIVWWRLGWGERAGGRRQELI